MGARAPHLGAGLALSSILAVATPTRAADAPRSPSVASSSVFAAGVWAAAQLIPSPLFVVGTSGHVGGGARWQVTPLVYSFGVAERPFRAFFVEPVARHAGAVELYVSPEWACCAPHDGTSWVARAGARLYLPLQSRGEALSLSLGASYYRASGGPGASFEAGIYVLFGVVGLTVTVSPSMHEREVVSALALRYF